MKTKKATAPYRGYVPVYLDDESKAQIKANLGKVQQLLDKLVRYAEDDYRFTLSWDEFNNCLSASLFDTSMKRDSGGFILSAKHVDITVALSTLVYLHEIRYADGWEIERTDKGNQVSW